MISSVIFGSVQFSLAGTIRGFFEYPYSLLKLILLNFMSIVSFSPLGKEDAARIIIVRTRWKSLIA